ncbi:MAG TPA: glutaredoxin family protein [Gemmatales bacterium]|nr:glutaredoxin family protein [Gemmatales bacterium]HMP59831.1 glutaredoxin family protein [Gemmatales bacterium]
MRDWWRFWERQAARGAPVSVVVYKNPHCPLCDDVLATLDRLGDEFPIALQVVDNEAAEAPEPFYLENAPVVAVAGKVRLWGRIEPGWLRREVQAAAQGRSESQGRERAT